VSTIGHWIVTLAYRHADASVLIPFSYTQIIWATLLGVLAFGNIPDGWTLAGAAVVIGSGLYTAHRERVRRDPSSAVLPAAPPKA
jgi:drug/metabolite transporter (DMT)-like permease